MKGEPCRASKGQHIDFTCLSVCVYVCVRVCVRSLLNLKHQGQDSTHPAQTKQLSHPTDLKLNLQYHFYFLPLF